MVARRWWLIPLFVVVLVGSMGTNVAHGTAPWAVPIAALAALVLFAIDRWDWMVLVNGALVAAYFATGGRSGPVFLTVVVGAFVLATRSRPPRLYRLLAGQAVLVWVGLLVAAVLYDRADLGFWQGLGVSALIAAAAAVSISVRARREARAEGERRAATEEQLRMAQDLHDGVGHGLAVIAMQAGVALHVLERDPAAVRQALEAIRDTSRESLDALRAELSQLTGDEGRRAPRHGLADVGALVDRVRAAGPEVTVVGAPEGLREEVDVTAYLIVQESLTNVLRHAAADSVYVELTRSGGELVVSVTDDGRGGSVQDEGMGLSGMRERVTALGGRFEAGPRPDAAGFRVTARLPEEPT